MTNEIKFPKLRGKIMENFNSYTEFSEALGTSVQVVSYKMSGERPFSKSDIEKWCDVLRIPISDCGLYFFEPPVEKLQLSEVH